VDKPLPGKMIPYARHDVDERDIEAAVQVLRSGWLTTGPAVAQFERAVGDRVGAAEAVAVSSGTAALHCALSALNLGPGDEVIVPPLTFVATASAVVHAGGVPVFADVLPGTLLLDPACVERALTPATKAVITVDYAGQPSHYDQLRELTRASGIMLLADGCHALGAEDAGRKVGSLADITLFSFHPAKHITSGEGGMATLHDPNLAAVMRRFRNHGIDADLHNRAEAKTWRYAVTDLGLNYRLTDFQCALGLSQLSRLDEFLADRREVALAYDKAFAGHSLVRPLEVRPETLHAYHLYVVRVDFAAAGLDKETVYRRLLDAGIGVNVHYVPVHLHPYYRQRFKTSEGLCPVAERAYEDIFSLPMFPGLSTADVARVVEQLDRALMP